MEPRGEPKRRIDDKRIGNRLSTEDFHKNHGDFNLRRESNLREKLVRGRENQQMEDNRASKEEEF